jgi:hypothetical protein
VIGSADGRRRSSKKSACLIRYLDTYFRSLPGVGGGVGGGPCAATHQTPMPDVIARSNGRCAVLNPLLPAPQGDPDRTDFAGGRGASHAVVSP